MTKLARATKIHYKTIISYELGATIPSAIKLGEIAKCLKVSTDVLLFGETQNNQTTDWEELTNSVMTIMLNLKKMDIEERKELVELTAFIAKDQAFRDSVTSLAKNSTNYGKNSNN